MSSLKIAINISALLASLLLATSAVAASVVPPGNGAATQYTEAFPTSGGNAVRGVGIDGGNAGDPTPARVLGKGNAKKLESEGQAGTETARVAAETAPSQPADSTELRADTATGGVSGQAGGKGGVDSAGDGSPPRQSRSVASDSGEGSSGLSQVIGQATGSSSGEAGLLLPLVLLAAVIGSLAYAWRRRVAH